jgi:two-component system nitrate/nitrite response regulator NarL
VIASGATGLSTRPRHGSEYTGHYEQRPGNRIASNPSFFIPQNLMPGGIAAIRIVIADARATFRQTLRTLLEPEADLTIVGEASDAERVQVLVRQLKPNVIIIDIPLFYRLKSTAGTQSDFGTVVMVPALERGNTVKAFLHGARAVVAKPSPPHIWSQSIRAVGAGQYWLPDESIAILLEALQKHVPREAKPDNQNDHGLTPREVEIVDKIVQGHSNKEVGQAFSICEKTVKHHLTNIFTKVGVSSRLELAVFALNHRQPGSPPDREPTLEEGAIQIDSRSARTGSGDSDHQRDIES